MKKMLVENIKSALTVALNNLGYPSIAVNISPASKEEFGDFSSNIALLLTKELNQNPIAIAQKIKDEMGLGHEIINEITVSKPGFINFKISNKYYYNMLNIILKKSDFGKSQYGKGKRANVEFVSANPTGPLTIGHGLSLIHI